MTSEIQLVADANHPESVQDLMQYSHIWVLFLFHQNIEKGWKRLIRPPRLGGNKKIGVFASRSTFRPNNIGMSAVKLLDIKSENGQVTLLVEGLDLVDGTPVIDIKPYIPYSDSIPLASSEIAPAPPEASLNVELSPLATQFCQQRQNDYPNLRMLIEQVLAQDPRPAYKQHKVDDKIYGIALYDLNIRWQIKDNVCLVESIEQA